MRSKRILLLLLMSLLLLVREAEAGCCTSQPSARGEGPWVSVPYVGQTTLMCRGQQVRLPYFPYSDVKSKEGAFISYKERCSPTAYEVKLQLGAVCENENTCHQGSYLTFPLGEAMANVMLKSLILSASQVQLDQGVTGYYIRAVCFLSCEEATLQWWHNGRFNKLGAYYGHSESTVDEMVKGANSVLNAEE